MQQLAYFSFYGNLNDFLTKRIKDTTITYSFNGTPSLKDAIEAIGIPHVEVEWILLNHNPAPFNTPLQPGSTVEVFPMNFPPPQAQTPTIRDYSKQPYSFVLDTHLGALARLLRLLGIDTLYRAACSDNELAQIAYTKHRIVLTRDIALLKQKIIEWGYWLRSQHPKEQLDEVVKRYQLAPFFNPFSRCLSCNGLIHPVSKETVWNNIPSGTKEFFQEFYQCSHCKKVYWKGSHYERMQEFIKQVTANK